MLKSDLQISVFNEFHSQNISFMNNSFAPISVNLSASQSINQITPSSLMLPSSNTKPSVTIQSCIPGVSNGENQESQKNSISKRKFFTEHEDELLAMAVMSCKHASWNKIAQKVPGRTPKQCRDRWVNYLQPSLNFGPWSDQEDQLLVSLVNKNGTHWTKMKPYFPDRSTSSLKNRWYWLLKNEVQSIPIDKSTNSNSDIFTDAKNTSQQKVAGSSNNYSEKNDYISNENNQFNTNINDSDSNNSTFTEQQQQNENPNFYFLLKNKIKKKNNLNSNYTRKNRVNRKNNDISNNYSNQNIIKCGDDDIITFNPDELNW